MKRTDNLLLNTAIALNGLQLFLIAFESRISIPSWLQVAGRMHPLVLHFPIAVIVFVSAWALIKSWDKAPLSAGFKSALLAAAVLSAGTALSGFFLSREEGYEGESLNWHKWGGIILSWLLLGWCLFYQWFSKSRTMLVLSSSLALVAITATGHWGAILTHGEEFLLAPVQAGDEKPAVLLEDALVYQDMVHPIFEAKCMGCHNNSKAKGELVMESEAQLLKGGKNGKLWDLKAPGFGLMMERLHLPMQNKKHMPPSGKPQLTDEEILIIERWIATGASFKQDVASLPGQDTLRQMASNMFGNLATETYDFAAAAESKIKQLNSANRTVYPLALNSPALAVDFFGGSQFKTAQLQELNSVKDQIVSLNLNKIPVKDEDLRIIAGFKNLRKLNLSFTDITGKDLNALQSLPHLQQLSVSGTAVTSKDLQVLRSCKSLSALYAWSTKVSAKERSDLEKLLRNTNIQWGFNGDTITMKLNAPLIANDMQVITEPIELQLKHFLPGVTIRYTLDGSDPDSLHSPSYKAGVTLNQQSMVKARAFKPGWISSDVAQMFFFMNRYKPDSVVLVLPPDVSYKGNGPATVIDNIKGDKNFRSGKWLGYKLNNLDMGLHFSKPTLVSSVTLSSLVDITSYIMPPLRIEVWGGDGPTQMKLLQRISPKQPSTIEPAYLQGFDCQFAPTTVRFLKVVAQPVGVLPPWHPGKGSKGWAFVDEVFVN